MNNRFVRASKYRHIFGTANKREQSYDNIRISRNAWDTNVVKVNPLYVAANWETNGGGAFIVMPHNQFGKLPEGYPLCAGHGGPVLDTDWNPFNDNIIASGSEDSRVMIWKIPEGGLTETLTTPEVTLEGHQRKVGQVLFHPTAEDVLASASADFNIVLWDIRKGQSRSVVTGHPDIITSIAWNYNGSVMLTSCKDKKVRLVDPRGGKIVRDAPAHQGIKGSRCQWMGDSDYFLTTGFGRTSERQLYIWDARNFKQPLIQEAIDQSSGILMPFYDADCKVLYLAGKGDGNIRYFEWVREDTKLYFLSEYKSSTPQRGMGFLPKRAASVGDCEVVRMYKSTDTMIEPISFRVPRKADNFQADLFPPCPGDRPAMSADEYFDGRDANPVLISLENGFVPQQRDFVAEVSHGTAQLYNGASPANMSRTGSFSGPSTTTTTSVLPGASGMATPNGMGARSRRGTTTFDLEALKMENDELRRQLNMKETRIKELEEKLARVSPSRRNSQY